MIDPSLLPRRLLALLLAGAASSLSAQAPVVPPGYVLVDDLVLPQEAVLGESGYTGQVWPGGVVPYVFDAAVSAQNQAFTLAAMAELEAVADITFVPRTSEPAHLVFQNCNCNAAWLGMSGGAQPVMLANWNVRYIVCHEIMHSLGYVHEQSRPDRNLYITINYANIQNGMQPQFDVNPGTVVTGPYDFLSIMHYGAGFFSNGGGPTITCNAPYAQYQNQLGNQGYLTLLDAQGLAARYGPARPPTISAMAPASAAAGAGAFTLTLTGTRFYVGVPGSPGTQGSVVRWDGAALPTTWVNRTTLAAQVPASLLQSPGCRQVRVDNAAPGGGLSNAFVFPVGLQTCAPNVEWELNDAQASLSALGAQAGGIFGPPAVAVAPFGAQVTLAFGAAGTGLPWDAAFVADPARPFSQTGLYTTGDQVFNLDLSHASLLFFSTGGPSAGIPPFPGPFTFAFAALPVPMSLTGQMLATAPSHPDGFALSQAAQVDFADTDPCTTGNPIALADDSFSEQPLGFAYSHYGAAFTRVFVGSNGRCTFNVGNLSALNALIYFQAGPPCLAPLWADLDPSAAGVVRFATDGFGSFGTCWQGVPNHGLANANTFSVRARNGHSVVFAYGAVGSATGLVGLTAGAGLAPLLPLDFSNRPYAFAAGSAPYEIFPSGFDLANQTLTFVLDAAGRPTGVN